MRDGFSALVCGYGVPKDILTDRSYHAYLVGVTNWLFERYSDASGKVVLVGGPTDVEPPFKRTEAGEMALWFHERLTDIASWSGQRLDWKIVSRPRALSTVENLLQFQRLANEERMVIFFERTRESRIRRLTVAVFPHGGVTLVPVDFDGSPRRYRPNRNEEQERLFLNMELRAAQDPGALRKLRARMKEKLALMRKLGPKMGHERLSEIVSGLLAKYAD